MIILLFFFGIYTLDVTKLINRERDLRKATADGNVLYGSARSSTRRMSPRTLSNLALRMDAFFNIIRQHAIIERCHRSYEKIQAKNAEQKHSPPYDARFNGSVR